MDSMKKVSRYTIFAVMLFLFLIVKNDSVYAYNNIDEYINARGYTTGTYVDNSGKIYWMTKGHTSSGTIGFSSVGLVVRYKSYTVEFLEPDNEGKKTSIQWNNDQYIHILGHKKYNGDTYCLYYIDKGDIIDAFIKRYPKVDFNADFIKKHESDNSTITLKIDSIMTHWVKDSNGNKVSQCGTLYTNNYQVITTSTGINNNINKSKMDMESYYYRVTGSKADFTSYYNMQAVIYKDFPNDIQIDVKTPTVTHNSNNKYYQKGSVYWVKADTPIEIKLEAQIKPHGNATLQVNWSKLRQYNGLDSRVSAFSLENGYSKKNEDNNATQVWENASATPIDILSSGYVINENNVDIYRVGYDTLYTFVTVKLKKGTRPYFKNSGSVETSTDGYSSRIEYAFKTSDNALYLYPDGTAPTIKVNGYATLVQNGTTIMTPKDISKWQKTDLTVNVSGTDTESGVKNCYVVNQNYATEIKLNTEGKHEIGVFASDNVGNSKEEKKVIKIDKTKPTVEVVDEEALDGYFMSSKTVKFKINDNLSGIKRIHLYTTTNQGGTVTLKDINISNEEVLNQELEYTFDETTRFYITVWDYADNGYTYDSWVKIDVTPPYIENVDTVYGWQNHSLTITPKIKDDISGVATYKFLDENNNELEVIEKSATDDRLEVKVKDLHFNDEQDTIYKVEMTDYAGNTGYFEFAVKIDKTPPIIEGLCLADINIFKYKNENVYYIPDGNVDVVGTDPKTKNENFANEIASGMARLELKDETGVVYGVYSVENGGLLDAYNDIYSIIYNIGENSQKFWTLLAVDRAGCMRPIKIVSNRAMLRSYVTIIPIENYE